MKYPAVVLSAVGIVREYYKDLFNTPINEKNIIARIYEWYCNTDISDSTILAAMAIHDNYNCSYDYDTIIQITMDTFPTYFDELAQMEEDWKECIESQNGEDFMYQEEL